MPFNVSRIVHIAPVEISSMPNIDSFNIVDYRARICNSMHGLSSIQAEKLCACLSVTPMTCQGLPVLTHQVPITKHSSSAYITRTFLCSLK